MTNDQHLSGDALELNDKQKQIWQALADQSKHLPDMYLGALIALQDPKNPDRLSQSALSIRELLNKLPEVVASVVTNRAELKNQVHNLAKEWKKVQPLEQVSMAPHLASKDGSGVTVRRRKFLPKLDKFFKDFLNSLITRREGFRVLVAHLSEGSAEQQAPTEESTVRQLVEHLDWFNRICHHDVKVSKAKFLEKLTNLENLLYGLFFEEDRSFYEFTDELLGIIPEDE